MNLTNYHSHCSFCDGHASMEEFVIRAVEMGFTSYGFSSHAPLPYHTRWNMDATDMEGYLNEFERLKKLYCGQIELYVGLEIDYLTKSYNAMNDYFLNLPLDYRIGSLHTVQNDCGDIFEIDCSIDKFRTIVDESFSGDVRYVTNLYLDRLMDMVDIGGFDIVGHADKMHSLSDSLIPGLSDEPWYKKRIVEYFEAIASKGYMVEMNTKKYLNTGLFFPDAIYYNLFKSLGIGVVVNSDSHYVDKINSGRIDGLRLLKKCGFESVRELHGGSWVDVEINVV